MVKYSQPKGIQRAKEVFVPNPLFILLRAGADGLFGDDLARHSRKVLNFARYLSENLGIQELKLPKS